MAIEDIDFAPVPGESFIEVYPISTRYLVTGFWYTQRFAGDTTWPPMTNIVEDAATYTGAEHWLWWASGRAPGTTPLPDEEVAPGIYYDDMYDYFGDDTTYFRDWDYIQMASDGGPEWRYNSETGLYEPSGPVSYMYAPGWMWFDLEGVDAGSIQRAEFICHLYTGNNFAGGTVHDDLDVIFQYRNVISEFHGLSPAPTDMEPLSGASILPPMKASDVRTRELLTYGTVHEYTDPYAPDGWEGYTLRHALPVQDITPLQSGGRHGIYVGLEGITRPTGQNRLWIDSEYSTWDEGRAEGLLMMDAGVTLPKLRLWFGGGVDIAGEALMTLGASGQIAQPAGPSLSHRAKLLRDRS